MVGKLREEHMMAVKVEQNIHAYIHIILHYIVTYKGVSQQSLYRVIGNRDTEKEELRCHLLVSLKRRKGEKRNNNKRRNPFMKGCPRPFFSRSSLSPSPLSCC